jgi:hypothetical protein
MPCRRSAFSKGDRLSDSITGIPANQVGQVVQDFVNDGATHIAVELADDGTYTVSAS